MTPRPLPGGSHKGLENTSGIQIIFPCPFRVPLDTDHKPFRRILDRFDDTIRCRGADDETRSRVFNGLMVFAVYPYRLFPEDSSQASAGINRHAVCGNRFISFLAVVDALTDLEGDVLV